MSLSVQELQRENVDLKHRLDTLLATLEEREKPLPCKMTASEEIIARAFRARSPLVVKRETIYASLYAFRPDCDAPDMRIIDVYVCRLRKKLSLHGIRLDTAWGMGWRMSRESAEAWDRAIEPKKDAA
ncbi:MAG TPA: winged helix-turn-helix domain-containing protein [Rhizobiaceae bacterium]|nr:winged helix-turn-helix domain-containing protein [Rhizobiaceae bacterium]